MARDLAKRREFAQQLRWLVTGRITNYEFDDFISDHDCLDSPDATIDEIAQWSWTLYSDTPRYRLRGKRKLDAELRSATARAVLLLRSGDDYRWPTRRSTPTADLMDFLVWVCVLVGVALAIIAAFAGAHDVKWVGDVSLVEVLLGCIATLTTVCSVAWYVSRELRRPLEEAFDAAGDKTCWPFLSQEDLADASQRGHLLAAPTPFRLPPSALD